MSRHGRPKEAALAARAARVLAGLAGGGRLVRYPGGEGEPPRYELRVAGSRAPRLIADDGLVEEMRQQDWLVETGRDEFAVTTAGRAMARRRESRDDPFRAQHLSLAAPAAGDPAPDAAAVVDNESPLAWLRRRRDRFGNPMIGETQYLAGERLRYDFTRARMTPRVTSDWSGTAGPRGRGARRGDPASLLDSALAARSRVEKAVDAAGPVLGSLLMDVCCFLTGLEEAERARGWPRRSGKIVLQIALDRLAAHYGLSEEARGRAVGVMRHWGVADYRPGVKD